VQPKDIIGFFDSGVGGLSVWQTFRQRLPGASTIYVGDTAFCPYGNKTEEEIYKRSEKITNFLTESGCKVIVVACNTATAAAINKLRTNYSEHLFIGMEPAIKVAAKKTMTGHIGLLATRGTINGGHYKNTREEISKDIELHTHVGHGLVELVEKQTIFTEKGLGLLKSYLEPMVLNRVDQLVLGCTHYPFLISAINHLYPKQFSIVEPSHAIVDQYLRITNTDIQNYAFEGQKSSHKFFTTSNEKPLDSFIEQVSFFKDFEIVRWEEN
jgi:glutamate racemase